MKKAIMLASILFSFLVSPVVLADDSVVGASNENVTGHVGFVGKYEYPKVTPKQNEPKGQVFQPHSKDNPFYGGVNVKGKEPVLPNTGDRSSLQNFALPLLLMIFGGAILIPKRTHN